MRADRSLYLDRSRSRLVGETDPEVAWLLVWKGREIPAEDVKRLGLIEVDGRVQQGESAPAVEMTPEPGEPLSDAGNTEPIMPPEVKRTRRRGK